MRGSKADSQGSGLGLAIARESAARHGGALRLTASPHPSGLRVSVAIPAIAVALAAARAPERS